MRWRTVASVLLLAGAAAGMAPAAASAAVREYWVGAVPVTWNIVPNGRDAIMGATYQPLDTVMPTVAYRRFSVGWKQPLQTATDGNQNGIPGPLLRARAGDRIVVHFKNLERAGGRAHSMHFHGVHYRPSSDGAFVPGVSGGDGEVRPGKTWTYRLTAGEDSVGVWPEEEQGGPASHERVTR